MIFSIHSQWYVWSRQTIGFKQGWALVEYNKAKEGQSAFKGLIEIIVIFKLSGEIRRCKG